MTVDFEQLAQEDGWDHSTLDSYKIVQRSSTKIHVAVEFSRHNKANERYHSSQVLYVLVKKGNRWGLQMRSVLGQTSVALFDASESVRPED